MPANAFDAIVVPVIRGTFLFAMLGGAVIGLARMLGAVASCFRAAGEGSTATAVERPTPSTPEAIRIPAADGLATAGAR